MPAKARGQIAVYWRNLSEPGTAMPKWHRERMTTIVGADAPLSVNGSTTSSRGSRGSRRRWKRRRRKKRDGSPTAAKRATSLYAP